MSELCSARSTYTLSGMASSRVAEIHELRMMLFELEVRAQRLSAAVSSQELPADLATHVDGLRCSVLSSIRWAHLLELAYTIKQL
jgi:hypothetical protein